MVNRHSQTVSVASFGDVNGLDVEGSVSDGAVVIYDELTPTVTPSVTPTPPTPIDETPTPSATPGPGTPTPSATPGPGTPTATPTLVPTTPPGTPTATPTPSAYLYLPFVER